ncbi:EEV type-1 membrane glycoprotein [NY_014 poxvirus]|uniref:EEV type-1 membrane glycoprotein n=1 Tax=NY_014 poxvirus TaxID=2025360 RepID=UPI000B99F90C|nr:EEV type-1 membrane glycoprotein [NY_014 poxvirus]AST09573.1 EEV type-1 membrane glycoprotein [NY_014 poxvirus]
MKYFSIITLVVCVLPVVSSICSSPTIPNARLSSSKKSFTNKETIDFTCDYGYSSPNLKATCKDDTWEYVPCKSMCKAPNNYIATTYKNLFELGYVLNLPCGKSFTCIEKDGSINWNDTVTCPDVKCNLPPLLLNGYYSPTKDIYSFGEDVIASCNDGSIKYELIGDVYISCIDNDKWTTEPICQVKCKTPFLSNGIITGSNRYSHGDVINFKCKNNFKLEGKSSSTCDNGVWSNIMPRCVRYAEKEIIPVYEDEIDEETDIKQNKKNLKQYEEDIELLESVYHTVFVIITISCVVFTAGIILLICSCRNNKNKLYKALV